MTITIRHIEPEDYTAIHQMLSDPEVAQWTLQVPLQSSAKFRQFAEQPPEGAYGLVAYTKFDFRIAKNVEITSSQRRRGRSVSPVIP